MSKPLKILYVGQLTPNDSALYRTWALERLGHTVIRLNIAEFLKTSELLDKVFFRLLIGPPLQRLNRAILESAFEHRVDLVFADKIVAMKPSTLQKLRQGGVPTVNYNIDNPFGPRNDGVWRLMLKCIPYYDLHVVQRDQNLLDYRARGARDVLKVQTAYEPTIHFPPPPGWSDANRDRDVSFVGTPYDNRAEFLTRLWREFAIPISICGNSFWKQKLSPDAYTALFGEGEVYRDQYRETLWRSRINLSFLTHSNLDEFAHKSFEIAACGAFLLVERSPGHLDRFKEDEEAVFFSDLEECAAKIRRYLPDEEARQRIAAAGQQRAVNSGYHNDAQMQRIIDRILISLPAVER